MYKNASTKSPILILPWGFSDFLLDENNKFKCKYRLVREMIDTIPDEQKTAGNSTESIDLEQKVWYYYMHKM